MLVVDRVVLEAIEQVQEVRELERGGSVGTEKDGYAGDEVVELRDLGEDVVPDDEARALPLVDETLSRLGAEERHQGRNATRLGVLARRSRPGRSQ